jgi:hypothetical protein
MGEVYLAISARGVETTVLARLLGATHWNDRRAFRSTFLFSKGTFVPISIYIGIK